MATNSKTKNIGAAKTADFDLANAFDSVVPDKATDKDTTEVIAIADSAEISTAPAPAATTTPPIKKARKKSRRGDRIISEPAGPNHQNGMTDEGWQFPRGKTYINAMAKLVALKPGIKPEEVSEIIHSNEHDADGKPVRLSTTTVYPGWNFVNAGFGCERKDGGWHLILPATVTMDQFMAIEATKLIERATLHGRNDIVELEEKERHAALLRLAAA